jgi:hypothetical protein
MFLNRLLVLGIALFQKTWFGDEEEDVAEDWSAPLSIAQALWRLTPADYSNWVAVPVFEMPLVFVCEDCARFAPAIHTCVQD